jgi:mono/diheme cytochrome c family protein
MRRVLLRSAAALLGTVVLASGLVYLLSARRMSATFDVPAVAIDRSDDSTTLARGEHVARIRGCLDCHGEDLSGGLFADAMPVMRLTATNLTRGANGAGSTYTDADWVRAIRSGVRPDGTPLLFMPSHEYRVLGPTDLAALVSWMKSVRPVDTEPVKQTVGPVGRVLFLTGQLPLVPAELIDHSDVTFEQPEASVSVEFGAYLAASCVGCHGEGFSGGPIPGVPPDWPVAANITPDDDTGIGRWSEGDFIALAERGVRPDGRQLDPVYMPWPAMGAMSDDERSALWMFLRALEPARLGGR